MIDIRRLAAFGALRLALRRELQKRRLSGAKRLHAKPPPRGGDKEVVP